MKKLGTWILGSIIFLLIFAGTLELIGYLSLKSGFRWNRNSGGTPPISTARTQVLESRVSEWLSENKKSLNPSAPVNQALRNEPALYTDVGLHQKRSLWGENQELAPNIDDEFRLLGAVTRELKWQVRYQTDEFGHRRTHHERVSGATANIVFTGCSFTFGEGVPDTSVFAARVSDELPKVQTYNYGIQGSSPARTLQSLMAKGGAYFSGVDEKGGAVVFTFIDDHVRRIVGSSQRLIQHPGILTSDPWYSLASSGALEYHRSFSEDPWHRFWIFRAIGNTFFAEAFQLEVPFIGDDQLVLVSKVMSGIRDEMRKHRPDLPLYVAIYPGETFYRSRLIPLLEKEQIRVLDYGDVSFPRALGNQSDLGTDRHPSPEAHALFARLLARDLESIVPLSAASSPRSGRP